MKWSYCERENGRYEENVGQAEIAFSVLSTSKNYLKREYLKTERGRRYQLWPRFLCIFRGFSRDRVLNYVGHNLSILWIFISVQIRVDCWDTEKKRKHRLFFLHENTPYIRECPCIKLYYTPQYKGRNRFF